MKQIICTECKWRPMNQRQADLSTIKHGRALCKACEPKVEKHADHEHINLDEGQVGCLPKGVKTE